MVCLGRSKLLSAFDSPTKKGTATGVSQRSHSFVMPHEVRQYSLYPHEVRLIVRHAARGSSLFVMSARGSSNRSSCRTRFVIVCYDARGSSLFVLTHEVRLIVRHAACRTRFVIVRYATRGSPNRFCYNRISLFFLKDRVKMLFWVCYYYSRYRRRSKRRAGRTTRRVTRATRASSRCTRRQNSTRCC